jgi:hypothetical protein
MAMISVMDIVRLEAGVYETLDGRWRVHRNDGGQYGCAPQSWWVLFYRTTGDEWKFVIQAITLKVLKQFIAEKDERFAEIEREQAEIDRARAAS